MTWACTSMGSDIPYPFLTLMQAGGAPVHNPLATRARRTRTFGI